jgi:hypothetical protein
VSLLLNKEIKILNAFVKATYFNLLELHFVFLFNMWKLLFKQALAAIINELRHRMDPTHGMRN